MIYRRVINAVLSCGCLCASACAPTKGYPGPELPEAQLSIISTQSDSNIVEVGTSRVDGTELGYSGILVLPGSHLFDFEVELKDPPRACRATAEFDDYGYRECRKKERKGKTICDCYDHVLVKENCLRTVYQATCRGEAATAAGRKYDVVFSKAGRDGRAEVREQGSSRPIAGLDCATAGSSEEEEERSLGSGRHIAYQYGFAHYCY